MTHDEARELLELYQLGVLDEADRREVDEHLKTGCVDCRKALAGVAAFNASILASVPLVEPPPRVRERVLAAVTPPKARPKAQPHYLPWMAMAAALALAVWLGNEARVKNELLAVARHQVETVTKERDGLNSALTFLSAPETRPVGTREDIAKPRGLYFVNPQSGILLIATNLPVLPAGRTYQMWLIPKGQAPVSAGLFKPDVRGGAVHIQPGAVDVANAAAVAISVEPEAGSTAPTTTPLLVTPVAGI
jgi:anti-sigma-K factor RskA